MLKLGMGFQGSYEGQALGLALPSSVVFDLDATITASYGGSSQTWANIERTPADGSSQTAYDFVRGGTSSATTDDPTFTGSAGSPSAYFALDGGDYFNLSGSNTTFLNGLQRTDLNLPMWMAVAFRFVSGGSSQSLIGTSALSTQIGSRLLVNTSNVLQFSQRGDTAAVNSSGPTLTNGVDYVVIVSTTGNGNTVKFWVNSLSSTDVTRTPNTCVTNTSNTLDIAAGGDGTARCLSGTRIYAVSMGNSFLTNDQAAKVVKTYNKRHGRFYA